MRRRTKQQFAAAAVLVIVAGLGLLGRSHLPASIAGDVGTTPASTTGAPLASSTTTVSSAAILRAQRDLRALRVSDAYVAGYDRDAFGQAWADTDRNGCDTRNDVLRRDLADIVTKAGTHGCVVLSGILHDPYTGTTINFRRGETSSVAVQIDHRYPLSLAWRHGASTWTAEQRELFANDQATNLVAVDGPANEAKSDSGPGEWMPPNPGDACTYASTFVAVATTWHLSIATADKHALDRTLTRCTTKGSKQ